MAVAAYVRRPRLSDSGRTRSVELGISASGRPSSAAGSGQVRSRAVNIIRSTLGQTGGRTPQRTPMETPRRELVLHLYHAALDRPAGERGAFLKDACKGDLALQQELESLLRYEATAARFLERPAAPVVTNGGPPAPDSVTRPHTTAETRSASRDFVPPVRATAAETTSIHAR